MSTAKYNTTLLPNSTPPDHVALQTTSRVSSLDLPQTAHELNGCELFHNQLDCAAPQPRNNTQSSRPLDLPESTVPYDANAVKKALQKTRYETLISRYKLQQVVRDLLPASRCAKCRRSIVPGKDHITFSRGTGGKAYIGNLQRCSSVWICPYCAPIITEHRKTELNEALYLKAPQIGLYPVMVTLTLSHHFGDELQTLLNVLCGTRIVVPGRKTKKEIPGARNILLSGRGWQIIKEKFGIAGWIHNLEILYSTKGNGWHPHIHMILMLDRQLDGRGRARLESQLRRRWLPALKKAGGNFGQKVTASWKHGCKVTTDQGNIADYVAKYGKLPANTWTVATEITKAQMKHRTEGFNIWELEALADDNVKAAARLVKEYYFATKGRNQLQWSQKLRQMLKMVEVTDEAITAADDTADDQACEATMDADNWKKVLHVRAESQRAFEVGGYDGLARFVSQFGAEAIKVTQPRYESEVPTQEPTEPEPTQEPERKFITYHIDLNNYQQAVEIAKIVQRVREVRE